MKKNNRVLRGFLIALFCVCLIIPSIPADAGANVVVLDSTSIENSAKWNNVSGDVLTENEQLIFTKESTDQTKFISKLMAEADSFFDELVTMEGKIKFTHLPEDEEFILGLGLQSIEAYSGESGNVEVIFSNHNGIKVRVIAYDDSGSAVIVSDEKTCGLSLNKTATVKTEIYNDQSIKVWVNNSVVVSGKLPVTGEGRVGFLQTGGCGAEITGLAVSYYKYDRPTNTDIYEDFEKGSMNKAVLTTAAAMNEGKIVVDEYEGNQVINFRNSGVSYLGTKHTFSNFEFTFDVPYMKTSAEYDEKGNLVTAATGNFGISFGCEKSTWVAEYGYEYATDMIVFQGSSVYSYNDREESSQHPYWQQEKGFSIKVTVLDGVASVAGKWLDENDYQPIMSYELPEGTPTGYVHFWIPVKANMALDNISIKNLDDNPSLVDVEYESAEIVKPDDAEYVPFERVYQSNSTEKTTDSYKYYLLPSVCVTLGIVALVVTAAAGKKSARKKEETVNE